MNALLTVSYRTQCSVLALLTADFETFPKPLDLQLIEKNKPPNRRRRSRKIDRNNLEASLHLILQEEHPPSSFLKVAERLKVDPRNLRRMFPELCRKVAAWCKQEREAIKAASVQTRCEDIEWAANQMFMQGIYPSRRRIEKFMKANGKIPLYNMIDDVLETMGNKRRLA